MKSALKILLVLGLVVVVAASASAQAVGNWTRIHGHVQSVQGSQMTFKADDGRVLIVDISQVSPSVQRALEPNEGATINGFPGEGNRFTARYITQDQTPRAQTAPSANGSVGARVASLVPQFVNGKEFQDMASGLRGNRAAAHMFVALLYQGFFERAPSREEREHWANPLAQNGDVRGVVESFLKSSEYAQKNKSEQQAIRDLYEGVLGRAPSSEEVRNWEQQIARR